MANAYFYSSTAVQASLLGSISAGATAVSVDNTTGWPVSFPFIVALDYGTALEELVKVTANSLGNLTVVRAFNGTSAQSHSLGAVARHVYCAQDATDFRTHEAATTGVHGVTGAVVGTTDTQVLSAKTLTAPTINAGALTGTFSGTPTFSGTNTHTADVLATGTPGTLVGYRTTVTGDTNDRFEVALSGQLQWGSGAAATDTTLARSGVGALTIGGTLTTTGTSNSTNYPTGGWTAYTPSWTTSTGLHIPSIGNGTIAGRYTQINKTVYWTMRLVAGSTTNYNSGVAADNWVFGLPPVAASASLLTGPGGASFTVGTGGLAPNGSDNKVVTGGCFLASTTTFNVQAASGEVDAIALTSVGFIDAVTPITWTTAGYMTLSGTYEAA